MADTRLQVGRLAEEQAAVFLCRAGYRIYERNYRNTLGEIDIIAWEGKTLCFIEVKARRSRRFGLPEEAISPFKQRQLSKVALAFLKEKHLLEVKARFDVFAMIKDADTTQNKLIKNAFELDSYFSY